MGPGADCRFEQSGDVRIRLSEPPSEGQAQIWCRFVAGISQFVGVFVFDGNLAAEKGSAVEVQVYLSAQRATHAHETCPEIYLPNAVLYSTAVIKSETVGSIGAAYPHFQAFL